MTDKVNIEKIITGGWKYRFPGADWVSTGSINWSRAAYLFGFHIVHQNAYLWIRPTHGKRQGLPGVGPENVFWVPPARQNPSHCGG
ncbi:hypothetical protein [Chloracidobacterium thermophilum]|uniref:hypothetical protein n=1 Tax=Chloracidobacterium thermophilum TaxID=458033 RepID=UPI0012FEFF1E|nr:hypothetical protein [Chloracidobacterium thermophilum]